MSAKFRRHAIALSAIAGASVPLAFAPFFWWWLAPCAYAVLFGLWRGAAPGRAFWCGFSFGAMQFLFGIYWIVISVHEIGQAPFWLASALMLGLVVVMALYPAGVGYVATRWFAAGRLLPLLVSWPALFVLAEWVRGWLFTGFGWLAPGYSQTESWLAGLAPVFGVHGVSWSVFVLAGALCSLPVAARAGRLVGPAAIIVVFVAGGLTQRVAWTERQGDTLSVALVQGAVPQEDKWLPAQLPETLNLYQGLTLDALGSDLIVWPEAAIPQYYDNMRSYLADIDALATRAGSQVVLGMLHYEQATRSTHNAVFALGQPDYRYVKRHLVPYGEYFPVPGFVRDWLRAMDLPNIDTERGDPDQPLLSLLGQKFAITICYEDVFGAEQLAAFPEATLLINVSNDAWFGDSIAPHQHLQIARMRAIEVRRWQLRSTNTGITAVIDPFGSVAAELPQFEAGVLRGNVTGMTGSTPYVIWGDWAVVVLAALLLSASLARQRRLPGSG